MKLSDSAKDYADFVPADTNTLIAIDVSWRGKAPDHEVAFVFALGCRASVAASAFGEYTAADRKHPAVDSESEAITFSDIMVTFRRQPNGEGGSIQTVLFSGIHESGLEDRAIAEIVITNGRHEADFEVGTETIEALGKIGLLESNSSLSHLILDIQHGENPNPNIVSRHVVRWLPSTQIQKRRRGE